MGCDIHLYVEKKIKGKWKSAQGLIKSENEKIPKVPYPDQLYNGRNYELFGALTEGKVRRDCNFHFGKLKGIPKDISPEIKRIYDAWGVDGHTPNYFSLAELRKADWEKVFIKESGMMKKSQWTKFQKSIQSNKPNWDLRYPHCQMTTCKGYEWHEWKVPIKEAFKYFYEEVVQQLQNYDWKCKPNEIRIVFWFDN